MCVCPLLFVFCFSFMRYQTGHRIVKKTFRSCSIHPREDFYGIPFFKTSHGSAPAVFVYPMSSVWRQYLFTFEQKNTFEFTLPIIKKTAG